MARAANPNPRSLKWLAAIALILLAAVSANLALNWAGRLPGIAIKAVSIKGSTDQVPQAALQAAVKRVVKDNFFTVDVNSVRVEFEKVPWVRGASVRRIWPDKLEITLDTHIPLARWGREALVNIRGEVFRAEYVGELPRFAGPPGSEREVAEAYRDFRAILGQANLTLKEVELSPRRAWQVKLGNGMLLELGRIEMRERLGRFVAVNRLQPELQTRRGHADLRYPSGFALKLNSPATEDAALRKAETPKAKNKEMHKPR